VGSGRLSSVRVRLLKITLRIIREGLCCWGSKENVWRWNGGLDTGACPPGCRTWDVTGVMALVRNVLRGFHRDTYTEMMERGWKNVRCLRWSQLAVQKGQLTSSEASQACFRRGLGVIEEVTT
jgi:hypothetical protein